MQNPETYDEMRADDNGMAPPPVVTDDCGYCGLSGRQIAKEGHGLTCPKNPYYRSRCSGCNYTVAFGHEKTCKFSSEAKKVKASNPKDAVGVAKVPVSCIPAPVIGELGLAMLEGALKYGRHNYRAIGVRASVYYDAVMSRHMPAWWEGEDLDPESGLSHITKAIASLVVLRDAMIQNKWVDDRPPVSPQGWVQELNKKAKALLEKYPEPKEPYTNK